MPGTIAQMTRTMSNICLIPVTGISAAADAPKRRKTCFRVCS
jgi:hypothetical protein